MKAWLAKIPGVLKQLPGKKEDLKITNIDVKWKQSNTVRVAQRSKKKANKQVSYTCTLNLTIEYQDATNGEEAPEQTAFPEPITVNQRCDAFLAKNNLPALVQSLSDS